MTTLSDADFNLLSQLAYLDPPAGLVGDIGKGNLTAGELVSALLRDAAIVNTAPGQEYRAGMEGWEWESTLTAIRDNPRLRDLVVSDYSAENYPGSPGEFGEPGNGLVAIAFEDPSSPSEGIVAFRGSENFTQSQHQADWSDNLGGAFVTDTEQQLAAAEYLEHLRYDSLDLTGHSKGSNLAQYGAVVDERVDRAVGFDGQGFSPEFLEKYASQIAANKSKITAYNLDTDGVSALLLPIAGTTIFVAGGLPAGTMFGASHKPNAFLDKGQIKGYDPLTGEVNGTERNVWVAAAGQWLLGLAVVLPNGVGSDIVDDVFDLVSGRINIDTLTTVGGLSLALLTLPFWFPSAARGYLYTALTIETLGQLGNALSDAADKLLKAFGTTPVPAGLRATVTASLSVLMRSVRGSLARVSASGWSGGDSIRLDTDHLRAVAARVRGIQPLVRSVDCGLDRLARQIEPEKRAAVLALAWSFGYDGRLDVCATHLNQVADRFDVCERRILNRARSLGQG